MNRHRFTNRIEGIGRLLSAGSGLRAWILLTCLLVIAAAGVALAAENFPPPEFTTGYQFPKATEPGPRDASLSLVDAAVLLAALSLAAYFALRRRSRRELAILSVFCLLYLGFYRHGCVCAVGSFQNVALALADPGYVLPVVVGAFFVLPLLFALFFGRVFCSAVCPLGQAQEVVLLRAVKVPRWVDQALGILPFLYLGVAVLYAALGSAFLVCRYDPFVLFFRLGGNVEMLVFGVAVLLLATVVGRPYCRFLCPYGALLRLIAPFARWRVRTTPTECVNCHLCADACPYGAIQPPNVTDARIGRLEGRSRLAWLVAGFPLILAAGGFLGWQSAPVLAKLDPTVSLANRVWLEEHGKVKGKTEASEAFATQGTPSADLYREAAKIRKRFDSGSLLLGVWVGLVIALRMISLSVRRRREAYQVDPGACVACGRCFAACPVGRSVTTEAEGASVSAFAPGEEGR